MSSYDVSVPCISLFRCSASIRVDSDGDGLSEPFADATFRDTSSPAAHPVQGEGGFAPGQSAVPPMAGGPGNPFGDGAALFGGNAGAEGGNASAEAGTELNPVGPSPMLGGRDTVSNSAADVAEMLLARVQDPAVEALARALIAQRGVSE